MPARSGWARMEFGCPMGSYFLARSTGGKEDRCGTSPAPTLHLGCHSTGAPLESGCLIAGHGEQNMAVSGVSEAIFGGALTIERAIAVI